MIAKAAIIFPILLLSISLFARNKKNPTEKVVVKKAVAQHTPKNKNFFVKEVTSLDEYNNLVHGKKAVVAMYTTSWCGMCKEIENEFQEVAQKHGEDVIFCKIDADNPQFRALCTEKKIDGYPIITYNKNGQEKHRDKGAPRTVTQLEASLGKVLGHDDEDYLEEDLAPKAKPTKKATPKKEVVKKEVVRKSKKKPTA